MISGAPTERQRAFQREALPHSDVLYNFALRMTNNAADAEDLLQETFLKAFRFWDKYEQGTNIRAWLFRIMKNSYINRYRKESREPETVDYDEVKNYYHTIRENGADPNDLEQVINGVKYTNAGREVYPPAFYDTLIHLKNEYGNPRLYITENGASFTDILENGRVHDALRISFLEGYMEAAAQAIRDGVNLHGYFIWSLVDNFEWSSGFSKRFGLVHVDHATQQRTIKDSGYWVRDLIRAQQA